jgi:predicted acetyltransferase
MAHVELIPALPQQEPVLANLLELYAHDFSEFHPLDLGEDGRFGYSALKLYWSERDHYPFLIRMDGKLAGFVLVKKNDGQVWDIAEFFVVRGCRRNGIGTRAAHQVWRRFPGRWEVRVMDANVTARHFWARAIATFSGQAIDPTRTENWTVFSFESKTATIN